MASEKTQETKTTAAIDVNIKELHTHMVKKISGHLHPRMKDSWEDFKNAMSVHLDPAAIKGMESALDGINLLLDKEVIDYGKYQKLRDIFKSMGHMLICRIIDDYTQQMSPTNMR